MKKIVNWFIVSVGIICSAIGVFSFTSLCCAGPLLLISGPLVAILGFGLLRFLHKYSLIFIVLGVIFFSVGVFLIVRQKNAKCILFDSNKRDCQAPSNCYENLASEKVEKEKPR